jgi:hypothetical protein
MNSKVITNKIKALELKVKWKLEYCTQEYKNNNWN